MINKGSTSMRGKIMKPVSSMLLLLAALVTQDRANASGLAANYRIEGANPDGTPYGGTVQVAARGAAWQFTWRTGSESGGIAVASGDAVAVAVGGAQCAVVLYRVGADGALQGTWVPPEGGALGNETATPGRDKAAGLAGDYLVAGSNTNGTPYKGALGVFEEGEHWRLSWRTGTNYEGYGLLRDGWLGVSWGSPDCGVVLYTRTADGNLDGVWKYYRTQVGRERLVRE
jgi:hypothetical protein